MAIETQPERAQGSGGGQPAAGGSPRPWWQRPAIHTALVGAVIGQAGPPCVNPGDCTSLAGTSNYGLSWYGVSAPVAPGPDQASGVSQLRFANLHDGWAYGPALYETTGGGWPWGPVGTGGQVVTALEASGSFTVIIAPPPSLFIASTVPP